MYDMTNRPAGDDELVQLERELEAETAFRAEVSDDDASEDAIEASYKRADATEERMLDLRATTPPGFAVKLRQLELYLEGVPDLARPWIDSLRQDLGVKPEG